MTKLTSGQKEGMLIAVFIAILTPIMMAIYAPVFIWGLWPGMICPMAVMLFSLIWMVAEEL